MTNLLEAIVNIIKHQDFQILDLGSGKNRANSMGEALETFIKDAFANTLGEQDETHKLLKYNEEFSWLGVQNNPPDIIINGGDAIEVKKIESANSAIALNSSFPKSLLKSNSPMITKECKNCEKWKEKDLIYCVGHSKEKSLKSLWMFYGEIYAAKEEIYLRIKHTISDGINSIPDVEFAETRELGRVNRVDPLGITNLRIRGMWHIQNPRKVFDYLLDGADYKLVCIIPTDKYNSFPTKSRNRIADLEKLKEITVKEVKVKNPNNPAKLINCNLITALAK